MTVPNREVVRDAFTTILSAAVFGAGKPVKQVLNYPADKITSSPVVCVSCLTASGEKLHKDEWGWQFVFQVEVLVRWRDTGSWTQLNAEDKLDEIWVLIAGVIEDNQSNANWSVLEIVEDTCDMVAISGNTYRREVIQVQIGGVRTA